MGLPGRGPGADGDDWDGRQTDENRFLFLSKETNEDDITPTPFFHEDH